VPAGGLFVTAGREVQKDRIEVSVWVWSRALESWLVDHAVIEAAAPIVQNGGEVPLPLSPHWTALLTL
jgi:phage terminase large subunit GpA-like protein